MLRIPVFWPLKALKIDSGEMAEWLTNSSGTNWNVEQSEDGPEGARAGIARVTRSRGAPRKYQRRKHRFQNTGEMAEWLKALPC